MQSAKYCHNKNFADTMNINTSKPCLICKYDKGPTTEKSSVERCISAVNYYYYYYYLTAIGLTPGGSSTVHIYTHTVHRIQRTEHTEQLKRKKYWEVNREMRAVPRLCELYPGICRTTEEKARKNLS
jgi:hypothetical protein